MRNGSTNKVGTRLLASVACITVLWRANAWAEGLEATVSARDLAVAPNPALVGQEIKATVFGVSAAPPLEAGAKRFVRWTEGPDYAFQWGDFSDSVSATAAGSFAKAGHHRIQVKVMVAGAAEYTYCDENGFPRFEVLMVTGEATFHVDVAVRLPEPQVSETVIALSMPRLVSILRTDIPVIAVVTRNGKPVPGAKVAFSSDDVALASRAAVTDAKGVGRVTASSGSSPSPLPNSSSVIAWTLDERGERAWARAAFTIVKVNDPTPANPEVLVGHLTDEDIYTVVLTYTVSPRMASVPIAFCLESDEGSGDNYPATLEDQDRETDAKGCASVRFRSGDMRETPTVKCAFQASAGATDVRIAGITGVSCYAE